MNIEIETVNADERLFCPHFAQNHSSNIENKSLSYVKIETSMQLSYGFVASSLQSRGVFVSILLVCGVTGSAYIPLNHSYLARVLSCDARTLKNCLTELLQNGLLLLEREKERIDSLEREASETASQMRKKAKNASQKKEHGEIYSCNFCKGSKEMLNGQNRIIVCPHC
jgi:hypothetical protein